MADIHSILSRCNIVLPDGLLRQALTHPSMGQDNPDAPSLERLETLGDSVLDLIVLDHLMLDNLLADSGELTRKRSELVNNNILGTLGRDLGLEKELVVIQNYIIVDSDLANVIESLFGAIYIQSGISACEDFLDLIWENWQNIALELQSDYFNPIGLLQEILQKGGSDIPSYHTIKKEGTEHNPIYTIQCSIIVDSRTINRNGKGKNIQEARRMAATSLIDDLKEFYF